MLLFIYLLPILSFIITLIFSVYSYKQQNLAKSIDIISWLISIIMLVILNILSFIIFIQANQTADVLFLDFGNWFIIGNFYITWKFNFDVFTSSFVLLISVISLLVVFYSKFYFHNNENVSRFLSYIHLFVVSMFVLVTSNNLIQMLIGWEGVSFMSYLLIVFYYNNKEANYASLKAFLINKASDIALILAIFGLYSLTGSLIFSEINSTISNFKEYRFIIFNSEFILVNTIAVLLLIAAFTKSAQIIFHIWLPDAMEAPTPVSALLHAATMVTAGVFLIIKLMPLYLIYSINTNIILIVASITLLYAALQACIEDDIKKIIAYSTISQLGYMFLSLGVGYTFGAIYHLFTHAFFKALLFLAAGNIIYSTGIQNIKELGGLFKKMPITYIVTWFGVLSLIGIYGFSGYFSKETILTVLKNNNTFTSNFAFTTALIGIGLTSFYSFRLIIYTFHNKPKYEHKVLENNFGMLLVLLVLAFFAIFIGKFIFADFVGLNSTFFWKNSVVSAVGPIDKLDHSILLYSNIIIVIALFFAYGFYVREKGTSKILKNLFPFIYNFFYNRMFLDLIYKKILYFFNYLSIKLKQVDDNIIDKYISYYPAKFIINTANILHIAKHKNVSVYILFMLLGAIALLTFIYCITYMEIK